MVELTNGSLKTAIREVLNEIPSITELKQEQESALVEFLGRKDVVAVQFWMTSLILKR